VSLPRRHASLAIGRHIAGLAVEALASIWASIGSARWRGATNRSPPFRKALPATGMAKKPLRRLSFPLYASLPACGSLQNGSEFNSSGSKCIWSDSKSIRAA